MGVVAVNLLQFVSLVVMVLVSTQTLAQKDWGETLPYKDMVKEMKVTKLQFYLHEIVSGDIPTSVTVVPAPNNQSSSMFGSIGMIDDPLTQGPELTSKAVGRAQGIVGFAGLNQTTLLMALSFVFTDDKFNGSTLSILTRDPITDPIRQFPVVGGTGMFGFAHGVAYVRTYWFNATTGDAILEYNVTVVHY
ncbi:Plant disease resistance response protein [Macleaya cordata]|uniref:Dirigent protein n=1 Tax=Macleaya cordata TaxID=56857 RepID=A0A200RAB2_MACCD|nr:Plant disease resistance response protein [Macleaya cordata]